MKYVYQIQGSRYRILVSASCKIEARWKIEKTYGKNNSFKTFDEW